MRKHPCRSRTRRLTPIRLPRPCATRVAHRLLGDAIEVRFDRGAQTRKRTIASEGARDRVQRPDIRRQDLQRCGEPHLREACRVETAREVAGVADRLLQQCGDLRCGRRRRVAAPSQLAGKGRAQRGDAGQVLAQAVMQLPPHALLFPVAGFDQLAFKPLLAGDVAGRGANRLPRRQKDRIPPKLPGGAALAAKPGLEAGHPAARGDAAHFRSGRPAIVRVDEIEERPRQQVFRRPPEAGLPCGIDKAEAAVRADDAAQIVRYKKEMREIILCRRRSNLR